MADIEFRVEGHERFLIGVRATLGLADEVKDALQEALNAAHAEMVAKVPRSEYPNPGPHLADTIRTSGVVYSPGGPGGGGFYEAELVAGEGIPYLNIAVEGRGELHVTPGIPGGPKPDPDWIPRRGANRMFFLSQSGKPVFARQVEGYEGDDTWILAAQQVANKVIAAKIAEIDAKS